MDEQPAKRRARSMASESPDGSHLRCPRCGLPVAVRPEWRAVEYCPECRAFAGIAVALEPCGDAGPGEEGSGPVPVAQPELNG
jgi:hypothetical protein